MDTQDRVKLLETELGVANKKIAWLYQNAALRDVPRGEGVRVPVKVVRWVVVTPTQYRSKGADSLGMPYYGMYEEEWEAKARVAVLSNQTCGTYTVARVEWEE